MNTRHQKFSEPTAPRILWTASESRSMFCECIWGGGAAPSPQTPLQPGSGWVLKFFFQGINFFFQGLVGVKPLNFFSRGCKFFFQGLPFGWPLVFCRMLVALPLAFRGLRETSGRVEFGWWHSEYTKFSPYSSSDLVDSFIWSKYSDLTNRPKTPPKGIV